MTTVAYMAIDAHARNCVLGVMDESGRYRDDWRFATTESELIRHVAAVKASTKCLAIEEGPLAWWIAQTVRAYVDEVFICDPRENALIGQSAHKSDEVDTPKLCRLLRLGELKRVYHPTEDHRAVFKAAVQAYLDLVDQQARLKQKIKAKYRAWGVRVHDTAKVYHPKRRGSYLMQVALAPVRAQLLRLYAVLEVTRQAKREALAQVQELGGRYPEIAQFQKIPGVGVVGAHVYDAWVQTPERFADKRSLWRYSQLGLCDRSSDGKPLARKRLDRAGNSVLKAVSYHAWLGALRGRGQNEVKQYFAASLERTHDKTHARLNTQRKILATMLALWKRKEAYSPERFSGS
ncbi:MAG TPA: transposase [Verrucomicrobiae bacterium]|nr:transposase [Verrucomicrobiae bacterium]